FFYCSLRHRDLLSFPTRRSSDLFVFVVAASSAVGRTRPVASCVEASPYATRRRSAVATTLVNQHPRHLRHPRSTSSEEIVLIRVDRKSTRLNSSHDQISYAVFCL